MSVIGGSRKKNKTKKKHPAWGNVQELQLHKSTNIILQQAFHHVHNVKSRLHPLRRHESWQTSWCVYTSNMYRRWNVFRRGNSAPPNSRTGKHYAENANICFISSTLIARGGVHFRQDSDKMNILSATRRFPTASAGLVTIYRLEPVTHLHL